MEHEYYSGLSLLILAIIGVKKLGPGVAKSIDKGIDVSCSLIQLFYYWNYKLNMKEKHT